MNIFTYIILFIILLVLIRKFVNQEQFNNIDILKNQLTYELVFEQLKMQQIKKNQDDPGIKKEIISDDPGSLLTFQLLEGIILVDESLQYYLVVSRGLLQIYQILIENNRVEIIRKITFNPESNTTWNYHYGDFLCNHKKLINSFDWRFQNDGNLVLYDYFGNPFWQSNTFIDKYSLSIDKFNLVLTKINDNNNKKIINIDRFDSIKIPIVDRYNNIMESDYIFEYFIGKINKIYNFDNLERIIVREPIVNEEFKKMKICPINKCDKK